METKQKADAVSAELEGCKESLKESKQRTEAACNELSEFRKNSEIEVAKLKSSIESYRSMADEYQKHTEKVKVLVDRFNDPITNEKLRCPIIQNNGVVRSLSSIVNIWLNEIDLGQSNAFRMYQCPVLKSFSMIAPFQIVETFMSLAASVGVEIDLPVKFSFKQDDDSWKEFPFHEQLELIARLCTIYGQRKNSGRPPEQRNMSIGEMSFMILMRACAHGTGFRLECYGVKNKGGGRVDVKLSFEDGWVCPFVDMDFSLDA